jgi:2-C-methyl-D-erythritol 2,4-cyclodiphosphate synthase
VRAGIGYDSHRFAAGRPLVLGGIHIPYERGLAGHSDADALLHAVADALLGAAALGDIGTHFPDTDNQWKDADSRNLLGAVGEKISSMGYRVENIDATIIAEEPRLSPYIAEMRKTIAGILQIETTQVSIKGKTNEKMGWLGRSEGIACLAVATLDKILA